MALRGISPLLTVIFLILATVAVALAFSQFGRTIAKWFNVGTVDVEAVPGGTETRDAVLLIITNNYSQDITVVDVGVETDNGLSPPVTPSLPLTVPARTEVSIVIGGDSNYWTPGKSYFVTVYYLVGDSALAASTVFVHVEV